MLVDSHVEYFFDCFNRLRKKRGSISIITSLIFKPKIIQSYQSNSFGKFSLQIFFLSKLGSVEKVICCMSNQSFNHFLRPIDRKYRSTTTPLVVKPRAIVTLISQSCVQNSMVN